MSKTERSSSLVKGSPPPSGEPSQALTFALTQSQNLNLSQLLEHPGIDGLALQEGWAALETQDDEYRWESLDHAFALAQAQGKRISLHVMASPRTPLWLSEKGAQIITATDFRGQTVTNVVPWDHVYLDKYAEFLTALAAHLQTQRYTPVLFDISVTVPVSEMNLVTCRGGQLGGSLRYDRSLYLDAWKKMIDAYDAAFPETDKFVSPPVRDLICAPEQDTHFYRDVMEYALTRYGASFWMFAADLNAEGSQRTQNYLDYVPRTSLGYQTIWSATDDPTHRMAGTYPSNLREAICKGLGSGARYFEIYAVDVLNDDTAIQEAIQAIHAPSKCQP